MAASFPGEGGRAAAVPAALGLVLAWAGAVHGHEPAGVDPFDARAAVRISQAAIGRAVGDVRLTDSQGRAVRLTELRGKPLIVSFVFTACTDTCPLVTRALAEAVGVARDVLGGGAFGVVTIGFDSRNDTPERMRLFARQQGADGIAEWRFLSADADAIEALKRDLGFISFPSPRGFDHLTQTTVLDPEGRVRGQIYGDAFDPPELVEPLRRLALGAAMPVLGVDDVIRRVRLFCTRYDPVAGRYRLDYSLFMEIAIGGLLLLGVGVFLAREWRRHAAPRA